MTATTEVTAVKVGDFFVSHWGYEESHVDFAKVVALTPKGVKIQAWTSRTVRDMGPQVYVVPGEGPVTGGWVKGVYDPEVEAPVETKRLQVSGHSGSPYLARNSFSCWSLWEGQEEYETGLGWGR